MTNFKEQAQNSPTFCIMPFTHIVTKTTGEFKLCCRSWPLYSVKDKSLLEVWNSEKYKRIRKQMLSGQRPEECQTACYYLEDKNVRSMRERQNILLCEYGDYWKVLDEVQTDYSMPNIRSIELKLNNLCNLKCRMCHPADSTQWARDWPLIADMQKHNEWTYDSVEKYNLVENPYICEWENHPSFFEDLQELAGKLDTIWFAGGEPLIDPMHYKILDSLKDKGSNIRLQYATNLTKINFRGKSIIDYWRNFKGVLAGISFDGVGDVFNYIRTNADFDSVVANIKTVKNIAEKESLDIGLIAACTFQAYNIFDLPAIFNFVTDNKIWIHTHRVMYPRFLSCQVLPQKLKRMVSENISQYLLDLEDKGLPLERYKNAKKNAIDSLAFLNGDDLSHLWPDFLKYSKIIDEATGSRLLEEVRPEIKEYLNDK